MAREYTASTDETNANRVVVVAVGDGDTSLFITPLGIFERTHFIFSVTEQNCHPAFIFGTFEQVEGSIQRRIQISPSRLTQTI